MKRAERTGFERDKVMALAFLTSIDTSHIGTTDFNALQKCFALALATARADERQKHEAENAKLRERLKEMLDAIDTGNIDSTDISADGEPNHKWHEEWAHYARADIDEDKP